MIRAALLGATVAVFAGILHDTDSYGSDPYRHFIHNLTLGHKTKYDKLLFMTILERKAPKWGFISSEVVYPLPGQKPKDIITCIEVSDQWRNGTNGYPELVKGGLGQRNATIRITSLPRYGFAFIIKIFGR